jgi:hypothetical protein
LVTVLQTLWLSGVLITVVLGTSVEPALSQEQRRIPRIGVLEP